MSLSQKYLIILGIILFGLVIGQMLLCEDIMQVKISGVLGWVMALCMYTREVK